MPHLHGTYTALVTPFSADGARVDLQQLDQAIDRQSLAGVRGVVPCGTTGEAPTLTEDEHRAVITRTIETARPLGLEVIAGTGSNCTAHAVAMHRFAHAAGATASLQVAPYYNRPGQEGLYRHFSAVADACDLPVVLYNIPGRTGVMIELPTVVRLAAHPNIVAIKDATGGLGAAQAVLRETDLTVLSGDDPLTLPLALIGAAGVVSVVSNVLPDRVTALTTACAAGDWEVARAIHDELLPLATALLTLGSNPVPVKAALAAQACDSGAVRLPLAPASEAIREGVRAALATTSTRVPQSA